MSTAVDAVGRMWMARCPECGYDLEPDAEECPNCGAILGDYEEFEELDE